MNYVHVRSIQKYHPGYKDRTLQWAKIYFKMVQGDPDCEMIDSEIDFARLIKFIILELEAQRPIPIEDTYLTKKGFDLKKRPIALTLKMLQNFLDIKTGESETRVIDKEEDKIREREDKNIYVAFEKATLESWNTFCDRYPVLSKVKEISEKRRAMLKKRYEKASFRDFQSIIKAIEEQPFLLGENQRKWRISFDWIIENDTNYIKTLERRYKDHSDPDEKHLMPARSR